MNSLVDRVTRAALRRGIRDGLLAGDGKWLALGALAWLVRYLMKTREPEVVVEKLAVGESLVVTNLGPQRGRKAKKQSAARVTATTASLGEALARPE